MKKNLKSLFSPEQITAIFSGSNLNKRKKIESQYGNMLRESKKIALFYGDLSKKYLQKLFRGSHYFPCQKNETIFTILESRLDVVLYRSGFFESIATAKQAVLTGGIQVNKKKVISPGTKIMAGDIVHVLKKTKKKKGILPLIDEQNNLSTTFPGNFNSITKNKQKKEIAWRFTVSPFLLSLLLYQNKIKQNQNKENSVFKIKWIERTFHKCNTILFSKPDLNRYLPEKKSTNQSENFFLRIINENKISIKNQNRQPLLGQVEKNNFFYQNQIQKKNKKTNSVLLQITENLAYSNSDFFINQGSSTNNKNISPNILDEDNALTEQQLIFVKNWFFFNYLLFLKKQFMLSTKKMVFSKQKKNSFDTKMPKILKIEEKKDACFFKQKNLPFFKEQPFFESKKSKPLHLEISYKSLAIIFLFPPQRISFPTFINISQIFK